ncbi:hypothetical protein CDL12_08039 [Handroanthus impetiginosus]|uniref:Purine permease n=1 Tax=Handroanthus impetiginosus TaxID=429701 RepID=A0A2G9HPS2_9LAMI|nr:hypothetical protein CDL12_08039 [Handroanthus impetiginosus]
MKRTYLIINCIILSIGNCGGPLIMRLYFLRGGKRIWLSSWLQTGGWPIILLPLLFSYTRRHSTTTIAKPILMKPFIFYSAAVIGIVMGLDNYLYTYGFAKLPVSTSSLLVATQLAFTAAFTFLLVKQKFTAYSINAAMSREAKEYELGKTKYYLVVVGSAIIWQCFFLGAIGVIFYSSSLLSGIIITVSLPIVELLAVIFYHEKFQAEKGISLFLSLWGFISYFFGEIKHNKKNKDNLNDNEQTSEALVD